MRISKSIVLAILTILLSGPMAGYGRLSQASAVEQSLPPSSDPFHATPISDLGMGLYLGQFEGALYPDGLNTLPDEHAAAGRIFGGQVKPRNSAGVVDPSGKIVLLSIGMSNTTQEFCHVAQNPDCNPWTFAGQAALDPAVNNTNLEFADGAASGKVALYWTSPISDEYNRIRDTILAPRGLTEAQVQAVWLKVADDGPSGHGLTTLPDENADAYFLLTEMGEIARALRVRYPNLQEVFVSSRIYAGYAVTQLNPEPYAYESGFSVKWLIQAQIQQMQDGQIDPLAGDLAYPDVAPWIAWGPYLWADGTNPRSDGLIWEETDFEMDGTHPSQFGETKVGEQLLSFFKFSEQTRCWFLASSICTAAHREFMPLVLH